MSQHETEIRGWTVAYNATASMHQESRDRLIVAVIAGLRAGERPTDVAGWCPFSEKYVRQLAREHGLPPRVKGKIPGNPGIPEAGG